MKIQPTGGFSIVYLLAIIGLISVTVFAGTQLAGSPDLATFNGSPLAVVELPNDQSISTDSTDTASTPEATEINEVNALSEITPPPAAVAETINITPTAKTTIDSGKRELITLAGGCFWCSEAFLQETPGVVDVISGYTGGSQDEANYKTVSTGKTSHREAVQVTFDPARISIDEVLDVYWGHIDPTDSAGQFADRGFHYTTAIFYHSSEQKMIAEASKARLAASGLFTAPVATIIAPYTIFYKAEEYHQDYYKKASEHYERYKKGSGRAGFVEENWAKAAALEFLESE